MDLKNSWKDNYLDENSLIFKKYFCFRARHSTDHVVLELIDEISEALNKQEYFSGIFVDFSKAFDTVNHKILEWKVKRQIDSKAILQTENNM